MRLLDPVTVTAPVETNLPLAANCSSPLPPKVTAPTLKFMLVPVVCKVPPERVKAPPEMALLFAPMAKIPALTTVPPLKLLLPVKITLPEPSLDIAKAPVMFPETVKSPTEPMDPLAPKVIALLKVAAEALPLYNAPLLLVPLPEIVKVRVPEMVFPLTSSVAPAATATLLDTPDPRAPAFPRLSVPSLTLI